MIFKTLPSIISSINQLGEASNKLKTINFSMVGLNAGNLDAYRNAISGISKEQAALLLSTQGLNQAQIDLVLSNEKVTASEITEAATLDGVAKKKSILTVEQQKQLVSSQALTTEKLAEISATLGLETAENGSLISKKSLNAEMVKQQLESIGVVGSTQAQIMNMLGLTTAETSAATASNVLSGAMAKLSLAMSTNPIGALITVIGIAVVSVYGLTKAFDVLTDSAEEIDERVDDLISKYNDLKTTADNNASTVESLADEYESLSKGVNDLGENVSLTSEEYARYNEIVNQIADMFPTLITGYTDEGTAILSLKGNVEQLRDAYKEAQQEAYNLLVATGKDSDGNDIMESYKNLSELDWWDSSIGAEDVTTTVKRDITKQILDLMSNMDTAVEEYDKLAQTIFDTYGDKGYNFLEEMGLPAIKDVFSDTSGITEEALIAGRATVQSYYQGFQSEIDTKLSKVKLMANAFLNTNDFYLDDSTNSELKNALSVMVNSIDEELANSFNGEQVKVGAYVNNIVNSIKGNEEVQKELIDLFTIDTTDMPVSDIAEQINGYITSIAIAINEDPEELKVRLGFDYVDDLEAQYQRAVDFAKDKFDGYDPTAFFKEHSINTQEEIDAWQKIAQGAKDAAEAEKEYIQGSTLNKNPISSIEDAKKTVNGTDNVIGLIEEYELLQEVLSDTGNIQEETYEKLLSCSAKYSTAIRTENGRITVNTSKLKAVAKSRQLDTKEAIRQTLALKKQEWIQWNQGIENYNGTLLENIETTYGDIDALQHQITQYELLVNSVDEASNAFKRFEAAQSVDEQDMFTTAQNAFDLVNETLNKTDSENYGKTNTKKFQYGMELLADDEDYEKLLNAESMEDYVRISKEIVKTLSPLFTENEGLGVDNLFKRADAIVDSGDIPKNDKEWADKLNTSVEMFQALKQRANLYEYNNREYFSSGFTNKLDEYQSRLSNVQSAQEALNECTDTTSNEYKRLSKELDDAKQKCTEFETETLHSLNEAYQTYMETGGSSKGSFSDYLKNTMDFGDNDITGSIDVMLDKSKALEEQMMKIPSTSERYKELGSQLYKINQQLSSLGYSVPVETEAPDSGTKSLEEKLDEYKKLSELYEDYKKQLGTMDEGTSSYKHTEQELDRIQKKMLELGSPVRIEIQSNITEIDTEVSRLNEKLKGLNESLKHASDSNEAYAIHMDIKGAENEKAKLEGQKSDLEKKLKIIVDDTEAAEKTEAIQNEKIDDKNFEVNVTDNATSVLHKIENTILSDKSLNVNVKVNDPAGINITGSGAFGSAQNTKPKQADADGTFHAFAQGTGSDVSIPKDEKALVNELGEEGIVRNGKLIPVKGGAQFINLKRGDIIFNH